MWLRGQKDGSGEAKDSILMNNQGNMCCLGFLGKTCGYRDEQLEYRSDPGALLREKNVDADLWPHSIVDRDQNNQLGYTNLCSRIIAMNDDDEIDDNIREQNLKELFSEAGLEVEFE